MIRELHRERRRIERTIARAGTPTATASAAAQHTRQEEYATRGAGWGFKTHEDVLGRNAAHDEGFINLTLQFARSSLVDPRALQFG